MVLVVRVEASAIAPVGASVKQPRGGALVDEAWVFPYRVGSQTEYLTPDQFGAFESTTARRAAALLDTIPLDQRGAVDLCSRSASGGLANHSVALENVDARLNVAIFRASEPSFTRDLPAPGADVRPLLRLPLDAIVTVWPEVPARWTVMVRGHLRLQEGRAGQEWIYDPSGIFG